MLLGLGLYVGLEPNLAFGNVNGIVVLTEAAFLYLASRGRWQAAGVVLGLSLTLKPLLLLLLLIPVLWRQWRALALAIAIPAGLTAIFLPFLVHGEALVSGVLPYLLHGQADQSSLYNTTLVGLGPVLRLDDVGVGILRLAAAGLALATVVVRVAGKTDDQLKLAEVAGLIVLVTLLCSSFGWATYGCLLLPLMASVIRPGALMRSPAAWISVYLFSSPLSSLTPFGSDDFGQLHLRFTAGYLGLLMVMSVRAFVHRDHASDAPAVFGESPA
jgi:arabinofuranan 3-O-arabinosyltransferase